MEGGDNVGGANNDVGGGASSENGTPVTVKIVKTAAGNRAKRSWIWQVMYEFKPSFNGKNVICSACKHHIGQLNSS